MADMSDYEQPEDLYYHKEHMWAREEGDLIIVGCTDFMQKLAGEVKRVVTLEEDDDVDQDKPFGTVSTGKWTGKLYSPITGEILEVNEDVEMDPRMINEDPYGKGWLIKVEPEDKSELQNLMKVGDDDYAEWFKAEIEKHAN